MNKLIIILLAVVMMAGCSEQCRPTAWILGGSDVDARDDMIVGRVGVKNEGVEFGAESSWTGIHGENQAFGAYILNEFAPTPAGIPYIGYHATVANDAEDGGSYGPIAGTVLEVGGIETVVEFQYLDYSGPISQTMVDETDNYRLFAGTKFKF